MSDEAAREMTLKEYVDNSNLALSHRARKELARLLEIEKAAGLLSDSLQGGFVVCESCGEQETTHDLDYAKELRMALGRL